MTPQEQQLLQGLTDRINQTVLNEKDPDAEQFIQQSLGRNPDALYILAQTVLVQQYALDQAKQQLDQLKQQAQQQPKHTGSFLGNLLGLNDQPTPPPPPQYAPVNNPAPPSYGPPQYGAPQYVQPGYAPAYGSGYSQGGGFLRSAMQTATGVAAGALAFEGIESLMHGFDHHAGYGMGGFGGGGGETINNYYEGGSPSEAGSPHGDLSDRFAAAGDQPSSDIEDRRDNFAGSDDTFSSNNSNDFADSSSYDDSSDFSGSDSDNFGGGDGN